MDRHMDRRNEEAINKLNMMYSEIEIDSEMLDRVSILQMMYDTVHPLSKDVIYCAQGEDVTLVNRYGIELATGTVDTIRRLGMFIAMLDKDNTTSIYCFSTGVSKKISTENRYHHYFTLKSAGTEYIAIEYSSRAVILDKYLNTVIDIEASRLGVYAGDSRICFKYRAELFKECTGYINRLTGKVESYDSFELCNGLRLIATEYHKEKGVSINKECIQHLRYKLSNNDRIVTPKSYEDIVKTMELSSTNTLFTIEVDSGCRNKYKVGLIRDDGVELLEPIYDVIQYMGSNNYLLTVYKGNPDCKAIYNTEEGIIYNFGELASVEIHKTLPLFTLLKNNGEIALFTSTGLEFNPVDLAKHFKCSYSKQRPDIIRVDLEYGKKYITNTLVPITNIHEITKVTAHEWVPM